MAWSSTAEKKLAAVAELDGHFYQTMNLGGPLFFSTEGKESKKLVVRAEYVDMLRQAFGEKRIKVHQRIIKTAKDLEAFHQVAAQNVAKGIPSLACILEGME